MPSPLIGIYPFQAAVGDNFRVRCRPGANRFLVGKLDLLNAMRLFVGDGLDPTRSSRRLTGGMCEVWNARDTRRGRTVAIERPIDE